jgi:hypothetical protein
MAVRKPEEPLISGLPKSGLIDGETIPGEKLVSCNAAEPLFQHNDAEEQFMVILLSLAMFIE